jgi:hypothetical protein
VALSPSIPTSFVPKQPVTPGRKRSSGTNFLLLVSFIIIAVTVISAGSIFAYQQYLQGVENTKGSELVQAQNSVSQSTVDQFVTLRNRLTAADTVLNQHVALSQFFNVLDSLTLQNVSFSALSIAVADDRTATINLMGSAKDFNSLAAESTAFASNPHIKSAIFSNIMVAADTGYVTFTITATLDPALVTETAATAATPALLPAVTTAPTANSSAVSVSTAGASVGSASNVPTGATATNNATANGTDSADSVNSANTDSSSATDDNNVEDEGNTPPDMTDPGAPNDGTTPTP